MKEVEDGSAEWVRGEIGCELWEGHADVKTSSIYKPSSGAYVGFQNGVQLKGKCWV